MEESKRPWQVVARRTVYQSGWIDIQLVDVKVPDGSIWRDLHLVDYQSPAVGVLAILDDGRLLLVDHYRFQTDTRGWEIPAGRVDPGETPEHAAARELLEETGHRAGTLKQLGFYHPSQGSSNQVFNVFIAQHVARERDIQDTNEIMGLGAFTVDEVRAMVSRNEVLNGLSLTALCWAMARGDI